MKQCAICKKIKTTESFSGRGSYCKPCQAEFNKTWRAGNAERVRAQRRAAFQRRTPLEKWSHHLMVRYGITVDQYTSMHERQGGVCAICEQQSVRSRLSVDHCHATGKIRGLLCERCNSVLGRVDDNQQVLRRAAAYLAEHQGPPLRLVIKDAK